MQGQLGLPDVVRRRSAICAAGACCTCNVRPASRRQSSPSSARSSPASTSPARRSTSRASAGPTSRGCRPTSWISLGARARPLRPGLHGEGVLAWLLDLDAWAGGIARRVRRGGDFLLHEEHPVASASIRACAGARTTSTRRCRSTSGWTHFELAGPGARGEGRALLAPRAGRHRGCARGPRRPAARGVPGRGTRGDV